MAIACRVLRTSASIGLLVASATAAAQTPQQTDTDGWNGAKWGMSRGEVKVVFRKIFLQYFEDFTMAPEDTEPTPFTLVMPVYDLSVGVSPSQQVTIPVRVQFSFDAKGLMSVSLRANVPQSATDMRISRLQGSLLDKYGPFTASAQLSGYNVYSWTLKSTTIELQIRHSPYANSGFTLGYNRRWQVGPQF